MKSIWIKASAAVGLLAVSAVVWATPECCLNLECCLQMLACCFE